ncbi:dephospho-CoA kinase [Candidatus Omnitrophota bacterium]
MNKILVGITGSFGAGKTTVAGMFRRKGAALVDADRIAHKLIQPHTAVYRRILACFPTGILSGKYISRRRLAETVFSDKKKLKKLNRIIHPAIIGIIKKRIKSFSGRKIIVVDAALLIESGLSVGLDKLIVVKCKPHVRMQRLKKKGLSPDMIKARLDVQLPQKQKIKFADFVIDNSASRQCTLKQVIGIWNKIINLGGERWRR